MLPAASAALGRDLPGGVAPHCLDEGPADPPAPPPACSHAVGGSEQAGGHASTGRPQGDPLLLLRLGSLKKTKKNYTVERHNGSL